MITFLNAALLAGFAAVAVPIVVHFFSRKKYDTVDWAAMQFLQVSTKTRRKVSFEHLLLMLLRMLAVGALVLALAGPKITSSWFTALGGKGTGERDIVLLIDGSASMAYKPGKTGTDAAKAWADRFIGTLNTGDRIAVFQARQQPVPLLGTLSADHSQARNSLDLLAGAKGGVDWPACVSAALTLLDKGRPERDIVILTDGQRYSWADENTLSRWELASPVDGMKVRVWVANVAPDRPADPPNASLDPIVAGRAVASAGREVKFKSAVRFSGSGEKPAFGKVRFEIDGRGVGEVPAGPPEGGVIPLAFAHKFTAGSHLVTLITDPDDLPGDNRQDFALEVLPSIPVLIVDGDQNMASRSRGGDFLRDALAPAKDPTPAFLVKVASIGEFTASMFTADVKGPGTPPRVAVFSNVATFTKDQTDAIEKYLTDGGSVLITLGERVDAASYNRVAFRGGQGWLPARPLEAVGDMANIADAPKPQPAGFVHPALEVFKEPLPGGLHTAYFPRRWKVDAAAGVNGSTGTVIAVLSTGDPFLVERGVGRGRALLTSVPLDNSWRTNFHTLPDFVRFAHEMMYYLAGAKAAERNLGPGQPILFAPRPDEPPAGVTVYPPDAPGKPVPVKQWPLLYSETKEPGAYRIASAGGRNFYYAVRSDPNESVLTPCSDEDRARVAEAVKGLTYINEPGDIEAKRGEGPQEREVWPVVIGLLLLFLLVEVWYTRALSRRGLPADGDESMIRR